MTTLVLDGPGASHMDQQPNECDEPATPGVEKEVAAAKASYQSVELLGDRKEVLIHHNDEVYRLRRTRHDKLILCK
jgi:hemin uptake protein HemP